MAIFNPTRKHEVMLEGGLARELGTVFDPKRPMGNVSSHLLHSVISAWLVGLSDQISPVLPRSLEWIDEALRNGEVNRFGVGANQHKVTLNWARVIGEWMLTGYDTPDLWEQCRVNEEWWWRSETRPWPANEIVRDGLDDYMAFTIGAAGVSKYEFGPHNEIYIAGINMYERWTGKSGPVKLTGTMKPREFGYALCLHYTTRQSFDEDALFAAGRRMLAANLQETWLGGGHYVRAATWLKIVYGHLHGEREPIRCILAAYDNMPDVHRPDFIPAS